MIGNRVNTEHEVRNNNAFRWFFIAFTVCWTAVIGISVSYNISGVKKNAESSAHILASAAYEKDLVYHNRNADHGRPGEQDATSRVRSDLVSLYPLGNGNPLDAWETQALSSLTRTKSLVTEITPINGETHLRYLRALPAEPGCLSCHGNAASAAGAPLGAISVAVPMAPFHAAAKSSIAFLWLSYGVLWLLGMLGLAYGMRMVNRSSAERDQAAEELQNFAKTLEERVEKRTRALKKTRDGAEKANRAKSEFLANMSHQIRTPLSGVIGVADILLRTTLDGEQKAMVSAIKTNGDSLLLLFDDILDFSKAETGELSLDLTPFNLQRLLADIVKAVLPGLREKGLKFICAIDPALPRMVVGDPLRIRQVLFCLLSNAGKFTPSGEVRFTVRLAARNLKETLVHFAVSDTGIGIPPEKRQRIFNAFEQGDTPATRQQGGSGLGLTICSSLLSLMGSAMHLESIPEKGSTFSFSVLLPVAPEDAKT